MTFLGVPGRLLAKRSWVCGRSKIAKVRGSRGRSKSAKVPSPPYPKYPRVLILFAAVCDISREPHFAKLRAHYPK